MSERQPTHINFFQDGKELTTRLSHPNFSFIKSIDITNPQPKVENIIDAPVTR